MMKAQILVRLICDLYEATATSRAELEAEREKTNQLSQELAKARRRIAELEPKKE